MAAEAIGRKFMGSGEHDRSSIGSSGSYADSSLPTHHRQQCRHGLVRTSALRTRLGTTGLGWRRLRLGQLISHRGKPRRADSLANVWAISPVDWAVQLSNQ